jgi:3-oxoadipate enol-lactonase
MTRSHSSCSRPLWVATADGARLHCEIYGDAPGLPVVLIHGLGGSTRSWSSIPVALARRRRVAVVDLRGCGHSGRGSLPITIPNLGDDMAAVIACLGGNRAHIVGHSLGGVIAQDLLTRHGSLCAAAVLVSTSSKVGAEAAEGWRRLADAVEQRGSVGEGGSARAFSRAFAENHPELVEEQGRISASADAAVYAAQARAASSYDYSDALATVENPVLVMQGLADRMTSPGGSVLLSRAIPNSELRMIEGVGHNLHVEMGDGFVDAVLEFLARYDARWRNG